MYADMRGMRSFYEALKAAYGPSHQVQAPLRSTDGSTLLTSKDGIIARWAEHFKGLFSDQRFVEETSLAKIPQADVKSFLDNPPTRDEIKEAIAKLKHGKSPGSDGIPAEVYQHGGDALLSRLHDLFTKCWELGVLHPGSLTVGDRSF